MPANKPSNRKERKGEVIRNASGECGAFADIIGLAFSNRHLNPYVTLSSASERPMRGRGHQIGPYIAASPDLEVILLDPQEGDDDSAN